MSTVVVERSFAEPVALEDIQAIGKRRAGCLESHRVRFVKSYFSRDRRRMICIFEAPDAESVRLAEGKAGVPFDKAWAARPLRHAGPEPSDDAVVVERHLPQAMDETAIRDALAQAAECYELWRCRIVWTYLSMDGQRSIGVYAGPDADSVRRTQERTGLPVDAIWPATQHEPQPAP